MENPKRILELPSLFAPRLFQEGLTAAPAAAPSPALAEMSANQLLKRQAFLKNLAAPTAAPSAAKDLYKKMNVQSVNEEIEKLLDNIDSLGQKDLAAMFDVDLQGDTKMNRMADSDLDIKKVTEQIKSAVTQLSGIFRMVMKKGALLARLGIKKTQSFMLSWNENVQKTCSKIAGALTDNHATDYEVSVFVDQTQKFCMALLIWVFAMNWYFVTFFVKENERYAFDPSHLKNFSITLYALFGPSYRALNCFNWALVEVPSMLRYSLSKMFIFFILVFFFFALVNANFHTTILTDFFNSMEGRYSTSVFCVISIIIVILYALWFVAAESGWHEWMNVFRNIPGTVAYFFIVLLYLIVVAVMGIPLAMFFVSAFFVMYSFLGVFVYRGSDTLNTFVRLSEDISNLSEVVEDEYDSKLGTKPFDILKLHVYAWNGFYRALRVMYGYGFELILIFILLAGISKYRNAFHDVLASKVKANQVLARNGPLSAAFKNLFTWLLIFNILLIIVIGIWMVRKWNTIQMLKCSTGVAPNSGSSLFNMLKRAKDFVGENVTNLVKNKLGKTEEQLAVDREQEAVLQQARNHPGMQRQAETVLQQQKDTRADMMSASKADVKEKWLTAKAWTPAFLKEKPPASEV